MNNTSMLDAVENAGVTLRLVSGKLKAVGTPESIAKIKPYIVQHRAEIISALSLANLPESANHSPANEPIEKIISNLEGDSELRYSLETHTDIEPDAVILTLAIRGKAACELRIPKSRYDGIALLELIEKHTTREILQ